MMSSSRVNLEKYLIPLDEINRATEKFSEERCIGGGGFGAVYRGKLSVRWKNCTVAVKRLSLDSHQGEREFRNEIEMISEFHHENIIAFIGYCDEGGEKIIIYEFASNGSLDQHLQDPNKMRCITWAQRLEICKGAAKGLDYLHSGLGEKNRIIHRDVKSANILLDDNMVAKICDFGLSRSSPKNQPNTHLNTKVAGTHFYLDPAYHESRILQKESDVYSFGVVLFEIMSGMLVYHERSIEDERQFLMNYVRRYHQNEPDKVIDPCIRDQIKSHSFDTFQKTAYQCISLNIKERPTMDTVVKKLEEAFDNQHIVSTDASGSMMQSLTDKLNSVSPYDQWIASGEIALIANHSLDKCGYFGSLGAIPRLTRLLSAPESRTQEHAVTALSKIAIYYPNAVEIISSGAIPGIVRILEKGSNEAQEDAAAAIQLLSQIDEAARVTIGSAGAFPPLVLLLSEGTTKGKEFAVNSIEFLFRNNDNCGRAITTGLVPVLIKRLITEPQVDWKETIVTLLAKISRHPEGMLAIGEAEAVPHLVELLGSEISPTSKADAFSVLEKLCSMDEKYLVEAQEHGVMGKLKYIIECGSHTGKIYARELQRRIKDHQHVDYKSDTEDVTIPPLSNHATFLADRSYIESLIGWLNSSSPYNQRLASSEIALLTAAPKEYLTRFGNSCDDENRVAFAKAGAIPLLAHLLIAPDPQTQEHAITALLNFSKDYQYDSKRIIISSGAAVLAIVNILEKGSTVARENAAAVIWALSRIDGAAKDTLGSVGAIPPLVLLLSEGTPKGKENAVYALQNLCIDYDNKRRALRVGAVHILMELLSEPQGVLKRPSLGVLATLLEHPEGKLATGEADVVPHLVELIGSESCQENAVSVLVNLCSTDEKYLVEAQKHGVMGKLKNVQQEGSDSAKIEAKKLRRMIKHHRGALKFFYDKITNIHL